MVFVHKHTILKATFVLFGSVLCVLFLSELFSRFLLENILLKSALRDWRDISPGFKTCYDLSDTLNFEPKWGSCDYPVLSDSSQKNDVYRILILGDSISRRTSYPRILEEKLNGLFSPQAYRYQIINTGVESYNTVQEVELMRSQLVHIQPNMVILQFTLNDFEFSPVVVKVGNQLVYFSSRGEKSYETNLFLFRNSSLYRFIKLRKLVQYPARSDWENQKQMVSRSLDLFHAELTKRGIPHVVLLFPVFADVQWQPEYDTILSFLQEKNISYIDLREHLMKVRELSSFAATEHELIDPLHPNKDVAPLVADILTAYIASSSALLNK